MSAAPTDEQTCWVRGPYRLGPVVAACSKGVGPPRWYFPRLIFRRNNNVLCLLTGWRFTCYTLGLRYTPVPSTLPRENQ